MASGSPFGRSEYLVRGFESLATSLMRSGKPGCIRPSRVAPTPASRKGIPPSRISNEASLVRVHWQASICETSPKSEATCQQAGVRHLAPKAPRLIRGAGESHPRSKSVPRQAGRHSNLMVEHDFLESESSAGKPGVVSFSELVELHVILADYDATPGEPDVTRVRRTPLAGPKTSVGALTMCRNVQRTSQTVSSKARRPRPQGFSSCEGPYLPAGVLHPSGKPKPS